MTDKKIQQTLTHTEQLFVADYVSTRSIKSACLAAGVGYNPSILKRPHVAAAIDDSVKTKLKKHNITAERVLGEIAKIAMANIDDHIDEEYLLNPQKAKRRKMAAVKSVTIKTRREIQKNGELVEEEAEITEIKLDMHDKLKALDMLGKHYGIYVEKPDEEGDLGERLTRAFEKLAEMKQDDKQSPIRGDVVDVEYEETPPKREQRRIPERAQTKRHTNRADTQSRSPVRRQPRRRSN